jgi:putative sigma-54 modulation protein
MQMVCVGDAAAAMIGGQRFKSLLLGRFRRHGSVRGTPATAGSTACGVAVRVVSVWSRFSSNSPRFQGNVTVQINVSARHGHLSGASQSKIAAKVSRLKRYFSRLTALNVTVDLENASLPTVEIVASAEHFHDMVSREHSGQLWRSVDGAVQKLEQQLRKHKEKVQDHKHVGEAHRS